MHIHAFKNTIRLAMPQISDCGYIAMLISSREFLMQ